MDLVIPNIDVAGLGPELILSIAAMFVLLVSVFLPKGRKNPAAYLSLLGIFFAFVSSIFLWGNPRYAFNNMILVDNFALFFNSIFLIAAGLSILMSVNYLKEEEMNHGEFYALILFATVGMMFMAAGSNLITIFLGLETMSISIYVLAGFFRRSNKSNESALKYLLLGAFSSAFLLYGIALMYGATGTTDLKGISEFLSNAAYLKDPMLLAGMGLLLVGFGFKIASVPFHMWTPDVYEGAPTSITAFMSVGVKAAAFAAFVRVFLYSLWDLQPDWNHVLWILAVLTMTLGNVVAISQNNIKRMLAYSSIAHAGYIMIGMVASSELGTSGILFYMLAYAFMNLGAFGVIILYGRKGDENLDINDYSGMGFKYPGLALLMTNFMFSLAGIPPTAGFFGKFYIFSAAIKEGYIWLAIIGVMNSLVSVYYYLRITVMMYMKEPVKEFVGLNWSPSMAIALIIAVIGTLLIGIFPSPYLDLARQSIQLFM
ncbi:MAG: NADH-quinone oxidoreductase subunit N [Syntrophales bacterium]|nr:NADH-quinone oxidoreductase subunit N [Syntrophales bacterium]